MTTGTLTAATEEEASLQHDLFCILLRFHREQGLRSLRCDVTSEELAADSARMAVELGAAIGGRYVPKRDRLADRNAAIFEMFNGRNRDHVMRHFEITKRVFYMVIARETKRRRAASVK